MPPSGVDYASEFLNGYAPEYVEISKSLFKIKDKHTLLFILYKVHRVSANLMSS